MKSLPCLFLDLSSFLMTVCEAIIISLSTVLAKSYKLWYFDDFIFISSRYFLILLMILSLTYLFRSTLFHVHIFGNFPDSFVNFCANYLIVREHTVYLNLLKFIDLFYSPTYGLSWWHVAWPIENNVCAAFFAFFGKVFCK